MTDILHPSQITDIAGILPGSLGLQLDQEHLPFVVINAPPAKLDTILPIGQARPEPEGITLRLWPNRIWTTSDPLKARFTIVDISHGIIHLILRGTGGLGFLANYTYADLMAQNIRQAKAIRTRLNHFDCTIWWANRNDVHILIERSLAKSFSDHLRNLALRHGPIDSTSKPRCPGEPDDADSGG